MTQFSQVYHKGDDKLADRNMRTGIDTRKNTHLEQEHMDKKWKINNNRWSDNKDQGLAKCLLPVIKKN